MNEDAGGAALPKGKVTKHLCESGRGEKGVMLVSGLAVMTNKHSVYIHRDTTHTHLCPVKAFSSSLKF